MEKVEQTLTPAEKEAPKVKEVKFFKKNLPISRKNLNPLLLQIRGLNYREALVQLTFCGKRIAPKVISVIERCRMKADKENLNPDRLVGSELYLTKGQFGPKKMEFKAKGRIGIRRRQYCHLFVGLKEVPAVEGEKQLGKFARGVNKERRIQWRARQMEAAKALKIHPLFITSRQVLRWEYEQEKAQKAARASAGASSASG